MNKKLVWKHRSMLLLALTFIGNLRTLSTQKAYTRKRFR